MTRAGRHVSERRLGAEDRRVRLHERRAATAERAVVEHVRPQIDGGRFPIKRTPGDHVRVTADIFADGHDPITAVLRDWRPASPRDTAVPKSFRESSMTLVAPGTDEWEGVFRVDELGWHQYSVAASVDGVVTLSPPLRVWVDRERARVGAWYEMFPRSAGPDPTRSGTFEEARALLPAIADLGFDVLYLPPIHPIGRSFRKGPNNRLEARPGDPGSPWAIGAKEGGHTAIEPGLGTVEDFDRFREGAERLGLEIALDLAWQCSPDHPWVREHPEWFRRRPDGTIRYAENPPKKYQDIYPFDFGCEDRTGLWHALLEVTLFWINRGVLIFRVDNPHTKTFGFWEWLVNEVHDHHPGVIFLSEAFTRPKPMRYLAKCGFSQSYTYFTWRNTKGELTEYFTELTSTEVHEYLRPNLFANTPDILHAYLQQGGRPAFEARLLLAATLGANYGIYSGFELCEALAVPGTEEYADSEKYQYKKRDWNHPGHIKELIARVNGVRHQERALQYDSTLRFEPTDNPELIAYVKSDPGAPGQPPLLMVVNLDPYHVQHGFVCVPPEWAREVQSGGPAGYRVRDLLDDAAFEWRGHWNYVRLEPGVKQGHILKLDDIA